MYGHIYIYIHSMHMQMYVYHTTAEVCGDATGPCSHLGSLGSGRSRDLARAAGSIWCLESCCDCSVFLSNNVQHISLGVGWLVHELLEKLMWQMLVQSVQRLFSTSFCAVRHSYTCVVFWAPLPQGHQFQSVQSQGHQFQSVQSASVSACQCWRAAWLLWLLWNLAIRGRISCCWLRGMSGCWMRKILTLAQTCMPLLRVPGPGIEEVWSSYSLTVGQFGKDMKRPWPVDPRRLSGVIPSSTWGLDHYSPGTRWWKVCTCGAEPLSFYCRQPTLYVHHISVYV